MKLLQTLLILPLGLALSAAESGSAQKNSHNAQNAPSDAKHQAASTDRTEDKDMKRSTEGHRPQDLNGDGIISRNEWPGNDASFRELDVDGDGVLTKKDRGAAAAAEGTRGRMYDRPVNDYPQPKKNQSKKR